MKTPPVIFGNLDICCLAAPTVSGEVRQRIEFRLAGWGLCKLADDVRLAAAELISNACDATPQGRIRIRFVREPAAVLLAVWDASDEMPRVRSVGELGPDDLDLTPGDVDRNGGWGLRIVRALASECGVSPTEPSGKWVWARFTS